jgi:hypothetical protein
MQELDAERRAAILRGRTPPPLPDDAVGKEPERKRDRGDRGHDRKKRKLRGEDDTDMDIRLAASAVAPTDEGEDARVLKLRNTKSDAPLTDHTGHIDLFPVDMKEAIKREKNAEVEKEKKRKERALEDQYTMRFSNAAGRGGLDNPWYTAHEKPTQQDSGGEKGLLELPEVENKNMWGNEDPLRKEREKTRITSNDPFAFMQKAQAQLQKSKVDKKRWAAERDRELRELRAAQEREGRKSRYHKRKRMEEKDVEASFPDETRLVIDKDRSSKHKSRHGSRSRSRDRRENKTTHRQERRRSRSRSKDRDHNRRIKKTPSF